MSPLWPAFDAHAHIDHAIDSRELLALRAVVFAATRTLGEFRKTLQRDDPVTVWGVGVHPGVADAIDSFSVAEFARLVQKSPLVSEVGLDGSSEVSMTRQQAVFQDVLAVLQDEPRVVSIHSVGATARIIDLLEAQPIKGAVLHWWRGTESETARALGLGCHFSVNLGERGRPAVIGRVPLNRILTETDHPVAGGARVAPGDVAAVESMLADSTSVSTVDIRRSLWKNLAALVDETRTSVLFPERVQGVIDAARTAR